MIFRCPHCRMPVQPTDRACPSCAQEMLRYCPTCNELVSVRAQECKYCGHEFGTVPESPRTQPEIVFLEPAGSIAWESKRGVFSRWWRTALQSIFRPRRLMKNLPREGGFAKPIAFIYAGFAQALLVATILLAVGGFAAAVSGERLPPEKILTGLLIVVAAIPLGYVGSVLYAFGVGAFWHLMAKLAGGRAPYRTTVRMVAYSWGASVVGFVPWIGSILDCIVHARLLYFGFRYVHGLSRGRAVLALFMPALILLGFLGVALVVAAIAGGHFPK